MHRKECGNRTLFYVWIFGKPLDRRRGLCYAITSRIVHRLLLSARLSDAPPGAKRDSTTKEGKIIMYAILKTGGKQYKVSEGDVIYVEKLGVERQCQPLLLTRFWAVGEGDKLTVGAPYVSGAAELTGTVEKTGKGKKINIFKMKPKKGYRRRQGHRSAVHQGNHRVPSRRTAVTKSHFFAARGQDPLGGHPRPRRLCGGRGGHRLCGDLQCGDADACSAVRRTAHPR